MQTTQHSGLYKPHTNPTLTQYITATIGKYTFAIETSNVVDVLSPQVIVHIPLVPPKIAGTLNIRGRIVTAINVSHALDIKSNISIDKQMGVVIEMKDYLYNLLVDNTSEVITLAPSDISETPDNIDQSWKELLKGVHKRDTDLLLILNHDMILAV